ncbi:bacillithiol system redox-active protein YtxJ [Paenibacillus crassostreae]|uniref:General stress protein n=1 Tax=Paenibacillus crassostreae TaxID=1763538 RepID=A0A167C737_9BACL|nr:bacillithiol system redox-active protein YtxJ [Paenibacillus crassostreae]AOZ91562.1 general stress protein [Paenibacillus crassostreae]OAB72864.1 general stress protein [Paenibacillus crassostreae]
MASITRLTTLEQLNTVLEASQNKPQLLFKHSTRCSISKSAYKQVMSYLEETPNESIDYGMIYVIEDRPISRELADLVGVKHESPQVILLKDKQPVWHISHSKITSHALQHELE